MKVAALLVAVALQLVEPEGVPAKLKGCKDLGDLSRATVATLIRAGVKVIDLISLITTINPTTTTSPIITLSLMTMEMMGTIMMIPQID